MRLPVLFRPFAAAGSIVLLSLAGPASAATFTWDDSNVSGTGDSSLNWFNAPQGTWGGGTPVQDDPATVIQFFSGTSTGSALANTGTVTQSTVIDGTSGFQLSSLSLLGRGSATANRPVTMTISGSGLNFAAASGTIQFNSVNGANGSIVSHTIAAPIELGSVGTPHELTIDAIGSNNGAPTSGGYRIDGVISELGVGSGLVKTGNQTLYLSAANTFTGGVTINGGKVSVGIASGTSAGNVLGTGPLSINAGSFEVNGNQAGVASQTVGSLAGSTFANLTLNNRSLTFGSLGTDTVYAGSANGTLIKTGTGTTTLFSAGSTVSNVTVGISSGTVRLGAAKNFTLLNSVDNEGTLDLDGYNLSVSLSGIGPNFTLLTGAGTFTNTATQPFIRGSASGTATFSGNFRMASNTNFRAESGGTKLLVIDGVLSGGAGNVTNSGNGFNATLRLTGSLSNTFTGTWAMSAGTTDLAKTGGAIAIPTNVRLTAGTLRWQADEQIADDAELNLVNSSGLNLNGYNETVSHLVSGGNGQFNPTTSGTLILAGDMPNLIQLASAVNVTKELGLDLRLTGTGGILFTTATNQNRTMRIGSGTAGQYGLEFGGLTRTVTVTGGATAAPGGIPALITSLISGSGGLTKDGDGLLRLSAANTLTGTTRIDAGTLDLGGNRLALQNSVVDFSGLGVLTNYSTTPVFGGLANYGGFTLDGTATRLTLNVLAGGTQTYSILPTGGAATIGFGKAGEGTLIFTGTSTWSGPTRIDGGVLEVGSLADAGQASPLGSGTTVTLGASDSTGTLRYTGAGHSTDRVFDLAGTTGGGGIEANGSGPLVLTSPLTATGGGTKTFTLSGTSAAVNEIASITGAGVSVKKTGSGLWRLTGASDFTGRLSVESGTILAAVGVGQTGPGAFGAGTGDGDLPLVGDSTAGAAGQAAVLLEGGVLVDRGLAVAALGSGATQEAILGTTATSGTATFGGAGSIKLGRDLTLLAADGGTVVFANAWQDLSSGTAPAVAFHVGSTGNAGTVVFDSLLPDSITAVNVRRGTLRLGPGGSAGDERIGFATPVSLGETGAGGTLDLNGTVQSLSSLAFAGTASSVSDGFASTGELVFFNSGSAAAVNVTGTGHTISVPVALDDAATFTVATGGRLGISGVIADGLVAGQGLTKAGPGILELSGSNTFTGNTTVSAGTLVVNGSLAQGTLSVAAGATLMGSGTVGGAATIFGIHAPGNSPGVETFADNLTYSGGSSEVIWDLWGNTTSNSPTVAFDQIVVSGTLDFAAATSLELDFGGLGTGTVDWDDSFWGSDRTWTLFDVAGTTTNFGNFSLTQSPSSWLDASGQAFSSSVRSEGTFSLAQQGSDVLIQYAVPEPAAAVLALAGLALATVGGIRRRLRA